MASSSPYFLRKMVSNNVKNITPNFVNGAAVNLDGTEL